LVPDSTELSRTPWTRFALSGQIRLYRRVPARLIIRRSLVRVQPALQTAQNAASAGDTLLVRGTCVGTTKISKDLTINGQGSGGTVQLYDSSTIGGNHTGFVGGGVFNEHGANLTGASHVIHNTPDDVYSQP
jgi:hypothetical protein